MIYTNGCPRACWITLIYARIRMLFVNDASVINLMILTSTKRPRAVKMILNRQIVSRKLLVVLPLAVNCQ